MAATVLDSAGESIDLLQTVRHQTSSSASSSVPLTSAAQHLPAIVSPTSSAQRSSSQRPLSSRLGKQRARLVLPVTGDVCRCDDDDDDDDFELDVEQATTRHCHCCCQCATRRHTVRRSDAADDGRGFRRRRSAQDDDDSDAVGCVERDHLTTSGLYLPPLFVTSAARRSGARETGDVHVSATTSCQRRACLSHWWTRLFCRHRQRRPDVPRRRRIDDDDDDDCWRLFPGRHGGRATTRDAGARRVAAPSAGVSLSSSPAAADDTVDVRRTSRAADAALLTERCRHAAAGNKSVLAAGRRPSTCIFCVIVGGLCVAVVGLVVGGLVIASPYKSSWSSNHPSATHSEQSLANGDDVTATVPVAGVIFKNGGDVTWEGGWSQWGWFSGGSDNGSRYRVFERTSTYHAAQQRCLKLGGYLARIDTIREQVFVEDFLRHMLDTLIALDGVGSGVGFWLGARRARGSHGDTCMFGQWRWVDAYGRTHGVISGFTAFIPGKPDNYFSAEECLFISHRDSPDDPARFLKWDDAPCDLDSVGGIRALCEVDMR